MRRTVLVAATPLVLACSPPAARAPAPAPAPPKNAPVAAPAALATPPEWPEALAPAMSPHGLPHASPAPLAPDAEGRPQWLAFVGPAAAALGAFRVGSDGATPVAAWPAAVRVLGAAREGAATYVLLETLGALDQPAGLRGVWIDAGRERGALEPSPLSLAGVNTIDDLSERLRSPQAPASVERDATSLLSALRAAATSPAALAHDLSADGADVGLLWQSIFVQKTGHLDAQASPSPTLDRALAIVRGALETQACGREACEAWPDGRRTVVRFAVEGGRWVIRAILEDAPSPPPAPAVAHAAVVDATADAAATTAILRARGGDVRVLGEATLSQGGGTIGVGFTDAAPGTPVVAVSEGAAARTFLVDAVTPRRAWTDVTWDAAFADVDGDGRTDVVLRLAHTEDGASTAWAQAFLAPPPTVQASHLHPDLASALAAFDAPDVKSAARAAASLPARGVTRDEACRLLAAASSSRGFRKVATADARVLRFAQPGMPTWLAKVVPAGRVGAEDVRDLAAHCAELACSAARPYCAWTGSTDSQHVWVGWRGEDLALAGFADYDGE